MIPKTKQTKIDNHLGAAGHELSIAFNEKSFNILTDRLYEDKIKSLIRELSSNADDSHRDAGIPERPIKVTLPSAFDNRFAVRDFGVGMDHETVMGLYSTLFATSKDQSNNVTGYIGIGSKAPFAYVNSFTVTCFDGEGSKRVYSVSLNDKGIPEITLVGTFDTDEPRGVEVSLAAKGKDAVEFQRKAVEVYFAYDVRPEVNVELDYPKPILQGDGWRLFQTDSSQYKPYGVRQGSVVYPFDNYGLFNNFVSHRGRIVVDVPMGSVQVSASRESLSLDEDTKEYLKERFTAVSSELQSLVVKTVSEAPSWKMAVELWESFSNAMVSAYEAQRQITRPKGEPGLNGFVDVPFDGKIRKLYASSKRPNPPESTLRLNPILGSSLDSNMFKTVVVSRSSVKTPRVATRVADAYSAVTWIQDPSTKDLEKLYRLFGAKEFVSASTLPDPGPTRRNSNGSSYIQGVYDSCGYNITKMPDDFLWVELFANRKEPFGEVPVKIKDGMLSRVTIIKKAMSLLSPDTKVLYVTSSKAKKLPEDKQVIKVIAKALDDIPKNHQKLILALDYASKCYYDSTLKKTIVAQMVKDKFSLDPSKEQEFEHNRNLVVTLAGANYGAIRPFTNVDGDEYKEVEEQVSKINILLAKKYPMAFGDRNHETIMEYIALCDSLENNS